MRRLLAALYTGAVRWRNRLYDTGRLAVKRADVPVVSIGNIEVGGTGKTPFTVALAQEIQKRGIHPVIVTRGYKGRLKGVVEVTARHTFRDVGDEAVLMARTAGIPVVKSPDRYQGAVYAGNVLKADVVLLDDGFQHRKLFRDLDIVLLSRDVSREAMLPAGPLREPPEGLSRARILVHTKGASSDGITASLHPVSLVDSVGRVQDLSRLMGRRVLAVSGIARPSFFTRILEDSGARVEPLPFGDHHAFSPRDIRRIKARAEEFDLVVFTEKDLVRLDPYTLDGRWLALRVEMRVDGMEGIVKEVEDLVQKSGLSRQG
ncbi:MAG TPA: tetraacyldisaccharide 4'-kinase [Deltaproteobacteria bacterium]|jgi:tetraacyldisaccharide 4'-kinase|nr:tetraacyldisaccharide 4'-kinase [Deltaproteobacteria bacterium]HOI07870.1 tetraacyldisaccharide 4'-kinase [Deltaproteobacteria bacterium]